MTSSLARPVALVGLPGAGKSTVGAALAARLGCAFIDFDVRIAAEAGQTIAQLFATEGESAFRKREYRLTETVLAEPAAVWAPGGGWLTAPGVLERIRERVGMIHLQVTPATALARVRRDASIRPLLLGADAATVLDRLARERAAGWATAGLTLDTEVLTFEQLVERAAAWVRSPGGMSDDS